MRRLRLGWRAGSDSLLRRFHENWRISPCRNCTDSAWAGAPANDSLLRRFHENWHILPQLRRLRLGWRAGSDSLLRRFHENWRIFPCCSCADSAWAGAPAVTRCCADSMRIGASPLAAIAPTPLGLARRQMTHCCADFMRIGTSCRSCADSAWAGAPAVTHNCADFMQIGAPTPLGPARRQ